MKRAVIVLLFLLAFSSVSLAEEANRHELWDVSYDMTLEECKAHLFNTKDLVLVQDGMRTLKLSDLQTMTFLGYSAALEIRGYDQISSLNLDLSFRGESSDAEVIKYKEKTDAEACIDEFIDAVGVVTDSLILKYGEMTQGILAIYEDAATTVGYNMPLSENGLNTELLKSIANRDLHKVAFAYRIDNITVEVSFRLSEERRYQTFDVSTKFLVKFLSVADEYAYDGLTGPCGEYPDIKNEVSLGL